MTTTTEAAALTARRRSRSLSDAIVLPVALVVLFAVFSVLSPHAFFTWGNVSSMLSSQTALLLLALALAIPLTADEMDLSVAGVAGFSAVLVAVLDAQVGWPVGLAVLAAIALSIVVGLVNGLLTTLVGIRSLIVTLGMSTILAGLALWLSGATVVTGVSTDLTNAVIGYRLLGIPMSFWIGALGVLVVWYVLAHTPVGQRLLVVGRNSDVARLSGVKVSRVRIGSLVASSVVASLSGIVLVGTSGSAGPSTGLDLLLPAFAAVFLGSTTIKPGRFNAWGTMIAVYFLVIGITGLQILGGESYVQNLFYGGALLVAVTFSQIVKKRMRR